ncbi:MAG: hypothetical protein WA160_16350 [Pseudobdellovibrio sp.]
MSLNKKILLLSLFAIVGLSFFSFYKSQPSRPLAQVHTSEFSGEGPVDRIIKIKIKDDDVADNNQQTVKIKTQISMPFDYSENLEYQWILTENIQLKKGSLSGVVNNLKANVPQTVEISVAGFSKIENRQIIFRISGSKNGRRIYADGIIASKKENTFENIVQKVEKIKAEEN